MARVDKLLRKAQIDRHRFGETIADLTIPANIRRIAERLTEHVDRDVRSMAAEILWYVERLETGSDGANGRLPTMPG